jgi:hypothetical protein
MGEWGVGFSNDFTEESLVIRAFLRSIINYSTFPYFK